MQNDQSGAKKGQHKAKDSENLPRKLFEVLGKSASWEPLIFPGGYNFSVVLPPDDDRAKSTTSNGFKY